ncbi:RNA polymerase sigma-70 factor [Massilibacteroides vaginae]|uniref:RNA polymerase sigma-70 factor n=1 Tax=Massilibacteroides vaginae TaxID=1673718 RepID=UPI000A1CE76D|nr:RNA polymerase sigma-70 factor [Massilibacteroides vaginae]
MQNVNSTQITSFESLYKQYYKRAFFFTKSYVHDEFAAEDIVSESLIKTWEQLRREHIRSAEALLLTILKNKSLDYLKHEAIRENAHYEIKNSYEEELELRISMLEACDPQEIFTAEIQQIVQHTLRQFSAQTRLIFEQSRFGNKSNKEIALELGLSIKSIEYHISKVLKALLTNLKDYQVK